MCVYKYIILRKVTINLRGSGYMRGVREKKWKGKSDVIIYYLKLKNKTPFNCYKCHF